jgi:hypothetical protein
MRRIAGYSSLGHRRSEDILEELTVDPNWALEEGSLVSF